MRLCAVGDCNKAVATRPERASDVRMAGGDWQGLAQRVRHAIATSSHAPVPPQEAVVHQAIGVTMETLGCSNMVALDALVDRMDHTAQRLLAVAVDLVDRQGRTGRPR